KVKELTDAGLVVIAAAGNLGRTSDGRKVYGSIHSPGISPYVITVGASNSYGSDNRADDSITTYSSRGPTRGFYTTASGRRVYDNI
ncbi:S8 family serine peptidase, partial [Escherichia coli]|nr:S8 family serine peptidase [Escherichia coli]